MMEELYERYTLWASRNVCPGGQADTPCPERYEKKPGNGCVAELHFNGRMTRRQLEFLVGSVKKYKINKTSLNQRGNVVVWNLHREVLAEFLAEAGNADIVYGSAYVPEKVSVRCAPLSGIEEGECFDVSPYADMARRWLAGFVDTFTVYFSNTPRFSAEGEHGDMAFCATEDGLFEVWAGNPADGHKGFAPFRLAERVETGRFLSYIKAGLTVRGQAASAEEYRPLFWQTLAALPDAERQPVEIETVEITKTGNGNFTCGPRVIKQKQDELYAVRYHPLGGVVNVAFWQKLLRTVEKIEDVEFRLDFRMNFYVCNLLAEEVGLPMDSMADGAFTAAEASPVHSFCGLCAKAGCDAQMFEHVLLKEMKKLGFADGVLPTFTVAGCKEACGQISDVELRFLAEVRQPEECGEGETVQTDVQAGAGSKLWFTVENRDDSGNWHSIGRIPQQKLTEYLIALGALPQSAGLGYREWRQANPDMLEKVTALYAVS